MNTHIISKTAKPKRLAVYAGLATLVIATIFVSVYCVAVSALNSALAGFQP